MGHLEKKLRPFLEPKSTPKFQCAVYSFQIIPTTRQTNVKFHLRFSETPSYNMFHSHCAKEKKYIPHCTHCAITLLRSIGLSARNPVIDNNSKEHIHRIRTLPMVEGLNFRDFGKSSLLMMEIESLKAEWRGFMALVYSQNFVQGKKDKFIKGLLTDQCNRCHLFIALTGNL